mmetsp:Transcript_16537/g.27498  ORF Transcript_16537/g.27498 Transcript_16537/m.27498 type:complete len:84 (+) Transcript_16537:260-511(+)
MQISPGADSVSGFRGIVLAIDRGGCDKVSQWNRLDVTITTTQNKHVKVDASLNEQVNEEWEVGALVELLVYRLQFKCIVPANK